jgi:hypothetical protein
MVSLTRRSVATRSSFAVQDQPILTIEILRGDLDGILALAADRHEAVGRHAGGDARAGGGRVAALGPESRAATAARNCNWYSATRVRGSSGSG